MTTMAPAPGPACTRPIGNDNDIVLMLPFQMINLTGRWIS